MVLSKAAKFGGISTENAGKVPSTIFLMKYSTSKRAITLKLIQ